MKKINLKRIHVSGEWLYNQLLAPFKKSFQIIDEESAPTSDPRASVEGLPAIYFAYDKRQRLNAQMLEMGIHKAEAIKSTHEHTRLA